ncbi:Short-chain-enoyl-CoA hydratase [Bacillus sp. CECT 9360]|nr:Short-chain-enoyl-CoA hydratase [Bacillus sp. CECT 9360]
MLVNRMNDAVLTEKIENGCLLVTINRPDKRNAINDEVMNGLHTAFMQAEADDAVKLVILTGAGDAAFCSGGDLSEFHVLKTEEESSKMLSKMGEIVYKLATFPKPTVAFLNGSAVGGGCELATACDFRIAREKAKFGFIQGRQGITTGWGGASLLYEKFPYQVALRLLLEANVLPVTEGKQIGFIDYIVGDSASVWNSPINELIGLETGVMVAYKQLIVKKWEQLRLKERISQEIAACARLWETEAHLVAVESFLNKKK